MDVTSENRVVVTGMGCVTPFGVGLDTFWDGLISGRSAVAATADEVWRQWAPVVAACNHFSPADFLPRKQVMNTDRFTQFALVAGAEALRHAGLLGESGDVLSVDGDNVGIALGSAFGGIQTFEAASIRLSTQNTSRVGARVVSKSIPNAAAAALAMQHHIRGPVMTYATACASAANAIGEALSWLYTGQVDVVLAGGAECLFTPTILAGLHDAGALATSGPEDLSQWSRPFDADRRGMVMGEGAAFLVLETRRHAERRGAQVLGELLGYGASCDAYHETAPHPEGAGAVLAMRRALKSARLDVGEIGYVNAHATSTPAGDSAEIRALRELFGEHLDNLPVSSIKGATGHMLGAAGAVEAVATVQALRTGVLPPTLNCDRPEAGAPADLVSNEARPCPVDTAISNSFGFGGQNGVLVFGRSGR